MNNVFKSLLALLFLTTLLLNCGTDSSAETKDETKNTAKYQKTNSPSNAGVDLPKSVSGGQGAGAQEFGGGQSSQGLQQLKQMIDSLKQMSQGFEQNLLFIDVVFSQLQNDPNTCKANLTMTFTEEMSNLMKAELGQFLSESELSNAVPATGTSMPVPPMKYATGDYFNDATADVMISIYDESDTTCANAPIEVIKWNANKTKISDSVNFSIPNLMTTSMDYLYDDSKKLVTSSMSMVIGDMEMSQNITMEECSLTDNTANCIKVKMTSSQTDTVGGNDINFSIKGRADDNGGYIESSFEMSGFSNVYKESFDGSGAVTGQSFSNDGGANFTNLVGSGASTGDYADFGLDGVRKVTISAFADASSKPEGYSLLLVRSGGDPADPADILGQGSYSSTGPSAADAIYDISFSGSDSDWNNGAGVTVYYLSGINDTTGEPTFAVFGSGILNLGQNGSGVPPAGWSLSNY